MKKILIVGLGNVGDQYKNTRHNIGFKIVNEFVKENENTFTNDKFGCISKLKIKGKTVIVLKPNTYMNLSGKAVKYWINKEKIKTENLLIITDDLNISFGKIRIKSKGSSGGHNGLKDIQEIFNNCTYPRFRFGIGNEYKKGKQIDFVLGKWSEEEKNQMIERITICIKAINSFINSGLYITMNKFNGK